MCKQRPIPREILGSIAVFLALASSQASAQTYHLKGSDTLFDIMTQAIANAQAVTPAIPGVSQLVYDGTGSGNAEAQMTTTAGAAGARGVQSIGPMSRNFRPKYIDSLAVGFSTNGRASWAPSPTNVIGLDAAVFVSKSSAGCKNLSFKTFIDSGAPSGSEPAVVHAVPNDQTLPLAFGNSSALNNLSPAVNYNNLLEVVLSGPDGSGTIKACSDPKRIQALQDLTSCLGVDHIEHIYRRDDNSGTTDTIRDRIMVVASATDPHYPFVGGRFCNGKAIGGIDGSAAQAGLCSVTRTQLCGRATDAACPGAENCQFNLNDQDFDPIRRPCASLDASSAPTSCSDLTTGLSCQAADNNPNCTQGLVIALSDTDPGSSDITTSIRTRVKNDPLGFIMGYAGREAAKAGSGSKGTTVLGIGFTDANVRSENYFLSRRLFLQNGIVAGQPATDAPNDLATNQGITGGGANQITAEQNLFSYMTDPNGTFTGGAPGRCVVDPVVRQFGFISCLADCNADPAVASNNLCGKSPAPAPPSPLGAIFPTTSGNPATGGPYVGALALKSDGTGQACTGTAACVSTGGACAASVCPAANARPTNSACYQNTDCASNVCADSLGLGLANGAGKLCN